jgi:hypothetical protein
MNGNSVLIDSNVVIDLILNKIELNEILVHYNQISVSFITYIEVLGYSFKNDQEKNITTQLMHHLKVIYPNEKITEWVIEYRQIKKIKIPDAIILATAQFLEIPLITSDLGDFSNIDPKVTIIKPKRKTI